MNNEKIKKWTILIYADGNNEMEEVMYKSLLACEKAGSSDNINVVIQIGKLGNYKTDDKSNWSGVRRYYIENGHSTLIEDIGKTNIADPNALYDFIKWGIESYRAERYMLVLSDHGGDFIGCFTDLSLNAPCIMGIPEMIEAVNAIRKNLGYIIDVLVLDMCYMNCVEVLYELGQEEETAVRTAVTYMDNAAYEGLNYENLALATDECSSIDDLNLFLRNLIDNQNFNMIAYEINHDKLEKVKLLFNDMAGKEKNALDILNRKTANAAQNDFVKSINDQLKQLVIYSKKPFKGINESIYVTSKDVGYLIYFYQKLSFSKNNSWTGFLSKVDVENVSLQRNKVKVAVTGSSESKIHYILSFNKTIKK